MDMALRNYVRSLDQQEISMDRTLSVIQKFIRIRFREFTPKSIVIWGKMIMS
jgi:hypothetical protein